MTRDRVRALALDVAVGALAAHALFLPMSIAGMQVSLAACGAAFAVAVALGWRDAERLTLDRPALLFALACVASLALSTAPLAGVREATSFRALAGYLLVSRALRLAGVSRALPRALALYLGVAAAAALLGVAQFRTGFDLLAAFGLRAPVQSLAPDVPGRFSAIGFFDSRLTLAHVLVVPLCLGAALLAGRAVRGRAAAWTALATALLAAGEALTFARTAWLGALAGLAAMALVAGRGARIVLALGLACAVALAAASPAVRARAAGMLSSDDSSHATRRYIWSRAVEVVADHPLFGAGVGGYPAAAAPHFAEVREVYSAEPTWAHDTWLTVLAETGPVGLCAYLWLWGAFLAAAVRGARRLEGGPVERAVALGALGAGVALVVVSLAHDLLVNAKIAYNLFALMGAVAASERASPERSVS